MPLALELLEEGLAQLKTREGITRGVTPELRQPPQLALARDVLPLVGDHARGDGEQLPVLLAVLVPLAAHRAHARYPRAVRKLDRCRHVALDAGGLAELERLVHGVAGGPAGQGRRGVVGHMDAE